MIKSNPQKTFAIYTLGCKVNQEEAAQISVDRIVFTGYELLNFLLAPGDQGQSGGLDAASR